MEYAGKDAQLWATIGREEQRQEDTIELIASENIVSKEVAAAQGSVLTNKYAEGYPGNRYYGGCQFIDQVEQLAIDHAKELFGAAYANVQPHSGSQANMAVYQALLKPGDTILGMGMDAGGHLTHGSKVNFSGKLYHTYGYELSPETEESAVFPGTQGGPLEHVIAGKAQAFYEDLQPAFKNYIGQVVKNAAAMAEVFNESETIRVVTGGTANHLLVLDLTKTGLTGKDAQALLDSVMITTNKEAIPNDQRSPFVTSGLRVGTPAITSRGFKEDDAKQVASLIIKALDNADDQTILAEVKEAVHAPSGKRSRKFQP